MIRRIAPLVWAVTVIAAAFGPVAPSVSAASPDRSGSFRRPGTAGPSADGRYIVVLRAGIDVPAVARRHRAERGIRVGRQFRSAIRGYSAALTPAQRQALDRDPAVEVVVPDERIEITQIAPTGVVRVGGKLSPMAGIDGVDDRVDADVAIVDTGIDATHPDLNVVGGVNCSTSDRSAWRDRHGHGTHVAGTVGARDDPYGVVGVAPGVRLWAVKILNDSGTGLLSWYVCGLDWIAAQRDPDDGDLPLIEAVNMSVAKWGRDDGRCGTLNKDVLHQAVCRVHGAGITVVAAAANDSGPASLRVPAAYDEVITVSALADTDGKPGGLGGRLCYSWGTYDLDDTFANFSNYGSDVDVIAPGKCIRSTIPGPVYGYMSGTSMAAPHVTGAAALYKATRPWAAPKNVKAAIIQLGSTNWKTGTDPDRRHERLLDVSRIDEWGDFSLKLPSTVRAGEAGGTVTIPVTVDRTASFFEWVGLSVGAGAPFPADLSTRSLVGFRAERANLFVRVPAASPAGEYQVTVGGRDAGGRRRSATTTIVIEHDNPTAFAPGAKIVRGQRVDGSRLPIRIFWPRATDPSTAISGYALQVSVDGGPWTAAGSFRGLATGAIRTVTFGHTYQYRVRALDVAGNWSDWATGRAAQVGLVQDNNTSVTYRYGWTRFQTSTASGGTTTFSTTTGAYARLRVTSRQIAILAPVGPNRGRAHLYIDGRIVTSIDLYAPSGASRRVVWAGKVRASATRSVQIRVAGTPGHPRVELDGILHLR